MSSWILSGRTPTQAAAVELLCSLVVEVLFLLLHFKFIIETDRQEQSRKKKERNQMAKEERKALRGYRCKLAGA